MKKQYYEFICLITALLLFMFVIFNGNYINLNAKNTDKLFENLTSTSFVLVDTSSGEILTSFNESEKLPVASICKLMTSLLVFEYLNLGRFTLEDYAIASEYACSVSGSQAFLDANNKYKIKDLLKSVIVASANDSSIVLAEHIAGNEQSFVKLMNDKAKELQMLNTKYADSTGLDSINSYSTAYDTTIILNEISKYELYNQNSNIWMDTFIHPSGRETELVNTNRLIKYYEPCISGKTGFTDEAGYCLSSIAEKNNVKLCAVLLNCSSSANRFKESVELYNYGFANFENKQILNKNVVVNNVKVKGGVIENVDILPKEDVFIVNKVNENPNVEIKYDINKQINAPLLNTDVVGIAKIYKNNKLVKEVELIPAHSVESQNFKDVINKIGEKWLLFN